MRSGLLLVLLTFTLQFRAVAAGPFIETNGVVSFEAESLDTQILHGSDHQWDLSNSVAGFSSTGYMEASPNNGLNNGGSTWASTQPELQYTVDFTTATTHYVWIRAYADNGSDDSIHAGLDSITNSASAITLVAAQYGTWNWTTNRSGSTARPTISVSSTGLHTFSLWMREDGMRVDRVALSVFTNFLGNPFHIPNNGEQDLVNLGIPTMRNPLTTIFSNTIVSFYTGNQFQGAGGNPGNQLTNGSALFYKKSTDSTWSLLPLMFFTNGVSNANNKYYSVALPADTFIAGDTVQYYFRMAYTDHATTFVFGNDGQRFMTELESEAQANPFFYTVRTPPSLMMASPADWRDLNIYQVITDRFYDGDPSNNMANPDGVFDPAGGGAIHGGDFKGLQQKLDYIKALGANAIWISPVLYNTFAQYHGYSTWDFYAIDPHWGTFDDMTNMIAAAHSRGIYVLLDMVCNHGGDLIDSTDAGYLTTFKTPPNGYNMRFSANKTYPPPFDTNSINPTITSLFHTNGLIQDFNNQQQVEIGELRGLDDLRTDLTYVRTNMVSIYQHWIGAADFDGFRIDTTKHIEHAFWQFWCPQIHQYGASIGKSNFFFFGETLTGSDSAVGAYTGTKSGGNYEYDSMLDYALFFTINPVFANASGNTQQIESHYNAIAANYDTNSWFRLITFVDNHDQSRFLSSGLANNNTNRVAVALSFLYTARGIPSLYYGTEQAFNGVKDANNSNREDMFAGGFEPGTAVGDNFNETHPLFQLVAKLNNLRRLYPSLCRGGHKNLWNTPGAPGLFAYSRTNDNEEVFVVFNTAGAIQTLTNRATIYPQGTVLVNLLDTNETITVAAGPTTPQVSLSPMSIKMFIAQSLLLPLDPVVVSQSPAHSAVNVSPAAPIVLQFSKPMDTNSVQAAFSLTPSTAGTFSWSPAHDTMTFTASGLLPGQTTNLLRLSASATDSVSGNTFFAPFDTYFVTAAVTGSDLVPPTVAINAPSNGSAIFGNLNISGTATDDLLLARVEIQFDAGTWITASGTASWNASLNTANFLNGLRTIAARATDSAGNISPVVSRTVRLVNTPGNYTQRISAGSFADVTNCDTLVWSKDQPYFPGSFGYLGGSPGFVGDTIVTIPCIDGQLLYERDRTSVSNFVYIFDCPEGVYESKLLESETRTNVANGNVFNISIQGQQIVTNLDVFAATGGMDKPLNLVFTNVVTNSQLNIQFSSVLGRARASGIQVRKISDVDADSDGIPDWWMLAYFNHATGQTNDSSMFSQDADGDGMNNLQEFVAGTEPTNAQSVLRVTKIEVIGNDIAVTWLSQPNKTNQLESTAMLASNGTWVSVGGPLVGTGLPLTQTDVGAATNPPAFYRIRLMP